MTSTTIEKNSFKIIGSSIDRMEEILTPEAIDFVCMLQDKFGNRREEL